MSSLTSKAEAAMREVSKPLVAPFVSVFSFLETNLQYAQKRRGSSFGSDDYLRKSAQSFYKDRVMKPPRVPATTDDPMIGVILEEHFGIASQDTKNAVLMHNYAMGAENIIGALLERYIAEELEPKGWAWCSGSIVRSVDFVYKSKTGEWVALQIKNRDNSENSSSKAIRDGTNILHWFRTFSKKEGTNWPAFPAIANHGLSEDGFRRFVSNYLKALP